MTCENITTLYKSECNICGGFSNASSTNIFTEEEMIELIEGVLIGLYTVNNLPIWYYERTAEALFSGVEIGFGSTLVDLEFGGVDYLLLKELQTNIYVFSAAKTYQQVNDISALLLKYSDRPDLFRKEAVKIFEAYSSPKGINYLSAEYQTAKGMAREAKNWIKYIDQKDLFPLLQYQTQGDDRVRPSHAELDNIIRPVGDAFWNNYSPKNGWRCRCYLIQLDEGTETDVSDFKQPSDVPDIFMMNPYKDKIIFSHKHPYFEVSKGDKQLALDNFNLPMP